jgi:hypothetical protein
MSAHAYSQCPAHVSPRPYPVFGKSLLLIALLLGQVGKCIVLVGGKAIADKLTNQH